MNDTPDWLESNIPNGFICALKALNNHGLFFILLDSQFKFKRLNVLLNIKRGSYYLYIPTTIKYPIFKV
jgi:hypothetical protein